MAHTLSFSFRWIILRVLSSMVSKANKIKKMEQVKGDSAPTAIKALSSNDLWQQWHFDYGILTVLTVPMFPSILDIDWSYEGAQLLSPDARSSCAANNVDFDTRSRHIGLKVLNTGDGFVEFVSVPPDCLIIQVGEVAQILTGGKLQATAHCVCRPPERPDISRETFVVFLQPPWHKELHCPSSVTDAGMHDHLDCEDPVALDCKEFQEVKRVVPSLQSRWKNGSSFAEFSKETTKQYYGANGAQAKR
ncbi:hypothetical protein L7F22_002240 [Adiantum nelumboides]|nr:hypothetical protein [Adiantum nelumboides]